MQLDLSFKQFLEILTNLCFTDLHRREAVHHPGRVENDPEMSKHENVSAQHNQSFRRTQFFERQERAGSLYFRIFNLIVTNTCI